MRSGGVVTMNSAASSFFTQLNPAATGPGASLFPLAMANSSANMANIATFATTLANVARTSNQLKFQHQQPLAINLAMTSLKSKSKKVAKPKSNGHSASGNCQCCCEAEKPFICDWPNCGKRFRQKPHLEAHRNIHTGRRFICEWNNCGKSFVRKYNLVEHQKLHSSVNPNMCTYPDCGKVFSSKYSLVRHQNAQHNLAL